MSFKKLVLLLLGIVLLCLAAVAVYNLPPVNSRLAWRVKSLQTQIKYALNPPEEVIFVPEAEVEQVVQETLQALAQIPTLTTTPTAAPTATQPGPTATPLPTPTATLTPTPIPGEAALTGFRFEYQKFNNCGPATLAVALSYWGWQGDQRDTRLFLRPGSDDTGKQKDDKNVSFAEMVAFIESQPGLKASARYGGDAEVLKRLVAAGFPVMVEIGLQQHPKDWLGHYLLITAYDDDRQRFTTQDVLIMPDLPRTYEELLSGWRAFNHAYLVIYPREREAEVLATLGPHADPIYGLQAAAQRAEAESAMLSGRDQYFATFNLGTSLVGLGDYAQAAEAYDRAFALYPTIPEDDRPWRMLWYQFGPFEAYYHTGRHQDVLNLAHTTLASLIEPTLEEAYYWAGMARQALGDSERALENMQIALELNPNYVAARQQLQAWGGQAATPTP
jgi:hypothetical protein